MAVKSNLSSFLDSTNDECRYRLWGIIIAPIRPIAAYVLPEGIEGMNIPDIIAKESLSILNMFIEKHIPITPTSNINKYSIIFMLYI